MISLAVGRVAPDRRARARQRIDLSVALETEVVNFKTMLWLKRRNGNSNQTTLTPNPERLYRYYPGMKQELTCV